ncbi:MAG: elongation factor P [Deltaproteobacteria bacterium]|nr:MAG: elongation factor P [Deltaproteobacteria bacterium]
MISTAEFKKGKKIEVDGAPCEILECQHYKPGKGGAFMKTKYRNLLTGSVMDQNFRSGMKFETPDLESREIQYLYKDGEKFVFMDMTSYEQLEVEKDVVGGYAGFLKDGMSVQVMLYEGRPISLDLPPSVVLEVTETDPGLKGDTVSGASKPATMETGLVVNVPLFINTGDKLKIDTRTSAYLSRE